VIWSEIGLFLTVATITLGIAFSAGFPDFHYSKPKGGKNARLSITIHIGINFNSDGSLRSGPEIRRPETYGDGDRPLA
jgi:hypothetical protein